MWCMCCDHGTTYLDLLDMGGEVAVGEVEGVEPFSDDAHLFLEIKQEGL